MERRNRRNEERACARGVGVACAGLLVASMSGACGIEPDHEETSSAVQGDHLTEFAGTQEFTLASWDLADPGIEFSCPTSEPDTTGAGFCTQPGRTHVTGLPWSTPVDTDDPRFDGTVDGVMAFQLDAQGEGPTFSRWQMTTAFGTWSGQCHGARRLEDSGLLVQLLHCVGHGDSGDVDGMRAVFTIEVTTDQPFAFVFTGYVQGVLIEGR